MQDGGRSKLADTGWNKILSFKFLKLCYTARRLNPKRCVALSFCPSLMSQTRSNICFWKKKKKKKMTETAVCADQSSSNGLNFLRFSCCLLFCVGGNPIGGLRKSQSKCFQMMMSCWKKKEKISKKKKKVFYSLTLWKKSHGTLMLISCWHEADYAVRQHYTLHLCTTLGSFVQNWGETADFTEGQ